MYLKKIIGESFTQTKVYQDTEEDGDYIIYEYETADHQTYIDLEVNKNGRGWYVWFYPQSEASETPARRMFKASIHHDDASRYSWVGNMDKGIISLEHLPKK